MLSSQEIDSCLVSFCKIFEARQSEPFRFKFHWLSSKILKFPEFNLDMMVWFELLSISNIPKTYDMGHPDGGLNL